jgi:hypothetical protein
MVDERYLEHWRRQRAPSWPDDSPQDAPKMGDVLHMYLGVMARRPVLRLVVGGRSAAPAARR